jgi:hypothetical protein
VPRGAKSLQGCAEKVTKPVKQVELANPLPQRTSAKRQAAARTLIAGLVYGGVSQSNAASGPKWAERPVERLSSSSREVEEEDPDLACYLWNSSLNRPVAGRQHHFGSQAKWGVAM